MPAKGETVRDVTVTHVFNARREIVFKAWTNPEYVAMWWGPHGFSTPVCELDVRRGGKLRIHMQAPDGTVYPMTGTYQVVQPPERLVYTTTPLDQDDVVIFEVLNTVTFVDQGATTLVTIHAQVLRTTAVAEMYLSGMEEGLKQTLESLGEFLEEHST